MSRIKKHKDCGGEFVASEISNDVITEITCQKCKATEKTHIMSKQKKDLIEKFEKAINGEKK